MLVVEATRISPMIRGDGSKDHFLVAIAIKIIEKTLELRCSEDFFPKSTPSGKL